MANNTWEFRQDIKRNALKRIVQDGNSLQSLISILDLQLSTDQNDNAIETLSFIETVLTQMDADCGSLGTALNYEQ